MTERTQNSRHKKRYSKISTEKREKLVQMVQDHGFTLTKAAKLLHIKRPTAKIILNRYKSSGTFFNKKIMYPRPLPILPPYPKTQDDIPESPQKEKQSSVQLKIEENVEQASSGMSQYGNYNQIGFVYYYQPFLDYHAFLKEFPKNKTAFILTFCRRGVAVLSVPLLSPLFVQLLLVHFTKWKNLDFINSIMKKVANAQIHFYNWLYFTVPFWRDIICQTNAASYLAHFSKNIEVINKIQKPSKQTQTSQNFFILINNGLPECSNKFQLKHDMFYFC